MASLFLSKPGQVIALDPGDGDLGLPLAIDGRSGTWFTEFRSILTEVGIALDGNFQFIHTLRDVIYVYAFGDRISQMRISGIAFSQTCPGGERSGIEEVLDFYAANKVAARADPVQVQIGVSAAGRFRGYITNFRADIIRPEARLVQFSLVLHVFPNAAG